jgi:multidrug efflux pump subunit AcrA (membrane-fusion protein)
MLNLSPTSVADRFSTDRYRSFGMLRNRYVGPWARRLFLGVLSAVIIILFLPWTQNIQADGELTLLAPTERPQAIPSTIAGRIEQWWVREGDWVQAGDTLVRISEVNSAYIDPALLQRKREKWEAKRASAQAYRDKAAALEQRAQAVRASRTIAQSTAANELERARLQVISDSLRWVAAQAERVVAEAQWSRQETLYEKGLKSLTELEGKRVARQDALAAETATRNAWERSQNAATNAALARENVRNDYGDELAKIDSERFGALAAAAEADGEAALLLNELASLEQRMGWHYLLAPQTGRVMEVLPAGLGEMVSAGQRVLTIVPEMSQRAVAWYVAPMNLPLLSVGQQVQFLFDGWPALVFSGWPGFTFGTFSGQITAIDPAATPDGKFRILVSETAEDPWPEALRPGGGARGIALLNEVPVAYEIWRQLNGFPPDFYQHSEKLAGADGDAGGKKSSLSNFPKDEKP